LINSVQNEMERATNLCILALFAPGADRVLYPLVTGLHLHGDRVESLVANPRRKNIKNKDTQA